MKKILIIGFVLCISMYLGYKYLYHEHRDIANEKAAFSLTVNELVQEFLTDENKANAKYLDKSITLKGKVTNVDLTNNTIVINEKVFALLIKSTEVKLNTEVSIQGRLIGFDSLLEEIKLDQAQIK
jgi:hypothetical protein